MIDIKTELVVKYSTILDLQSHLRRLLEEYAIHTSRILVQNVNRPEENIILMFADDFYVIECNWNRVIFRGEGKRTNYEREDGPLRFYFEIVDKLSQLGGFGKFSEAILECFDLVEAEYIGFEDEGGFGDRYLSAEVNALFAEVKDNAVNVTQEITAGQRDITFGPFKPESDPSKHNLQVFQGRENVNFSNLSGMLVRTEITTRKVRPEHGLYTSLAEQRNQVLDLLSK